MSAIPSVIGLGEALWDVFYHAGGCSERRIGGAPANFAFHAAQHGLAAVAVSALGSDEAGDALAEGLRAAGVSAELQRVPHATGEVAITLGDEGVPQYSIRPDAAWDHLALTSQLVELARRANAICFGSLAQRSAESRETIETLLAAMPQGEVCYRVFDVNLRCGYYSADILRRSLQLANVVKLNEEEMEILGRMEGFTGQPQLEQAAALMQRYGLQLLILTCGATGSYVLGQGGNVLSYLPTPRVHVVDTVGAGDSFTATFISALLLGLPLPEAHAAAVQVAAWVCTQAGAMPPLPESLRLMHKKLNTN